MAERDTIVDLNELVGEIVSDSQRKGHAIELQATGENVIPLKRQSVKRVHYEFGR